MDKLNLDQHISQQFNADLEHLRTELLAMGGMVEKQLTDAIVAIESADGDLAEKVLMTEDEIDQFEVKIDKECMTILARRQPAASDLRLVMIVSKTTRDLERIGDEANKIARMAVALNQNSENTRGFVELRHLANNVTRIVRSALDAFAHHDVYAAIHVVKEDKDIDRDYRSAIREMITLMMEDPREITRVLNILWALRALERIGDHARNIAEHVIYLVKGTDVRHTALRDIEEQIKAAE